MSCRLQGFISWVGSNILFFKLTFYLSNPSSDSGDGQKRFLQVGKFSTHTLRIMDRGGALNELELHDASWRKSARDRSRGSGGASQVRASLCMDMRIVIVQENIVIIAPSVVKRNNWVMKINSEIREAEETIAGLENPGSRKHSLGDIL